jgi:hypothetical protein
LFVGQSELMLSEKGLSKLKLSGNGNECKPLPGGRHVEVQGGGGGLHVGRVIVEVEREDLGAGAYTRPLFSST